MTYFVQQGFGFESFVGLAFEFSEGRNVFEASTGQVQKCDVQYHTYTMTDAHGSCVATRNRS